jgi:uncharacterized peroxidase-related enzyme
VNPGAPLRLVKFYKHLFDPNRSYLTDSERELIAVVSSAANHCSYCVFNHAQALGAALQDKVRAQRIALGYHHVRLSARKAALADIAHKLTEKPEFGRLRSLGFDEPAILEVLEISAFFNYANRLTVPLNVVPDREFFAN